MHNMVEFNKCFQWVNEWMNNETYVVRNRKTIRKTKNLNLGDMLYSLTCHRISVNQKTFGRGLKEETSMLEFYVVKFTTVVIKGQKWQSQEYRDAVSELGGNGLETLHL